MFTHCMITELDPDPERAPMQATLAGLQVGDVITDINGRVTKGVSDRRKWRTVRLKELVKRGCV